MTEAPAGPRERRGDRLRMRDLWAVPALALLVALRLAWVQGDPSDFPIDRNINAALQIRGAVERSAPGLTGGNLRALFEPWRESPEFPFIRLAGWLTAAAGGDPIAGARLFSLLASLAGGVALWLIGRRIDRRVGLVALWLYAVDPLSVFIGRTLLPDGLMAALLIGAFWAAGAGLRGRRPAWMLAAGALLTLAALAKLPAFFFAPAIAAAFLQATGWRRGAAWGWLAGVGVASLLIVCAWYGIEPWNPMRRLAELSAQSNNLLRALPVALSPGGLAVTADRLLLALTLPGLLLATMGWLLAQGRRGTCVWLNAWFLSGVLFVMATIAANTYWAWPAAPAGLLLAAMAVVHLARVSRWSLAALALLGLVALVDPATTRVRHDMVRKPAYARLGHAARGLAGRRIFYGTAPADVSWFAGGKGKSWDAPPADPERLPGEREADWLLSTRMGGETAFDRLFERRPVAATRPGDWVIWALGRSPGRAAAGAGEAAPLAEGLGVVALETERRVAAPGETLRIQATFARDAASTAPLPAVALEFVHAPTGEALTLMPRAGGAWFAAWFYPRVQLPDFDTGARETVHWRYQLPDQMPAGRYDLRLRPLGEEGAPIVDDAASSVTVTGALEVVREATAQSTLAVDPAEAVWLRPVTVVEPGWFGGQSTRHLLAGGGQCWLAPALPAGRYRLKVSGEGWWLGDDPHTRWPLVEVFRPGEVSAGALPFNRGVAVTRSLDLDWAGPGDWLMLRLVNPATDYLAPRPFPLYPGEAARGIRAVVLRGIEFERVEAAP